MNDVLEILTKARALIEKPENWGKGHRGTITGRPLGTCCAAEAIEDVTSIATINDARAMDERLRQRIDAYRALENAAGLQHAIGAIVQWNDNDARTHAEVLAAFDHAIEAERAALSKSQGQT